METETLDPAAVPLGSIDLLAPGTSIAERYHVVEALGRGGYAVVYRARDLELNCEIALKVLRPERMSEIGIARFRREVAIARDASSPRLVRVFDIGISEQAIYLTMELVDGPSLRERMAQEKLDLTETLRIAIETLEGLSVLHSLGIVHRDVKPANVLMSASGEVKLADFGLARYSNDDYSHSMTGDGIVGTVDYLSPEQALGQTVDQRSDLYSFGIMLFQMLTGRFPFVAASSVGVLLERLKSPAENPRKIAPHIPAWLARVVTRLLARDPGDRYGSAAAVIADLRTQHASRAIGKTTRRAAAMGALLLVLLASGAWFGAERWVNPHRFAALQAMPGSGIKAVDDHGRILWTIPHVDPSTAFRGAFANVGGGQSRCFVVVLRAATDFRPSVVRTLSFIDLENGRVLRQALLPSAANSFPGRASTFQADSIRAIDLDHDGIDEILVTYTHVPGAPSFTVLYEPKIDRARVLFQALGHHRVAGAADLDHDGRPEVILAGINNGFGWYNAAAAVRVIPWIGETVNHNEGATWSPESSDYQNNSLLWYALLPRGRLGDAPVVTADSSTRTLTFRLSTGTAPISVGFDGFQSPAPPVLDSLARQKLRWLAYEQYRQGRQLMTADPRSAQQLFVAGAEAAGKAGDPLLHEAIGTAAAKAAVAAGDLAQANETFSALIERSESAAVISFTAADAFHLRGDLERAVKWYERGMMRVHLGSGMDRSDFIDGIVFARGEQGRWKDALDAFDQYESILGHPAYGLDSLDREYARLRAGRNFEIPAIDTPASPTGLQRYLLLELWSALIMGRSGRVSAPPLLPSVRDSTASLVQRITRLGPAASTPERLQALLDTVLAEIVSGNPERGGLWSLRGELLEALGRSDDATAALTQAVDLADRDRKTRTSARLECQIAKERLTRYRLKHSRTS